jgi:hypothetical protein
MFDSAAQAKSKPVVFCAAAVDAADATFQPIGSISWQDFYLSEVPFLYAKCCDAMGIVQSIFFSDELPIQASWNSVSTEDPNNPRMYVGVGNLEAYPFSSLVAVILHELGHIFTFRSSRYAFIFSRSVKRQQELLADVMAGAAFARMETASLLTKETVRGQCSTIDFANSGNAASAQAAKRLRDKQPTKIELNARKLITKRISTAQFQVLRENDAIETLSNYSMIGETPDEDPTGSKCLTTHNRSIDFVSMVAAVSSWRTFGDLPDAEESHGSPSERYRAFSLGYSVYRENKRSLADCLEIGLKHLNIKS